MPLPEVRFRIPKPAELHVKTSPGVTQHDSIMRVTGVRPVKMAEQTLVAEDDILPAEFYAQASNAGEVADQGITRANTQPALS